jgi:peptidoglycan LD-endopeptidase LytH
MRYVVIFLIGAAAGAAAAFFILGGFSGEPARLAAGAPPPLSSREQAAPAPSPIEPEPTPLEETADAEPMQKTLRTIELPAELAPAAIVIPVAGARKEELRDMFREKRGDREHRAIDIPAERGTPVLAAIDGPVAKLFLSRAGGITVYQYDPAKAWIYYYAHLDGYAPGLVEGQQLRRGEVIGFVGTSGNAAADTPHLHFSVEKLTEPGRWWKSEPVDPYPLLQSRGVTIPY